CWPSGPGATPPESTGSFGRADSCDPSGMPAAAARRTGPTPSPRRCRGGDKRMPEFRSRSPGETRAGETNAPGLPGLGGAPGTSRRPSSSGGSGPVAGSETSLASQALSQAGSRYREPVAIDLEALQAEPGLIDELAVEDLPALLERCAVEHSRVAAVERLAHTRLARVLPELTASTEEAFHARPAARRIEVHD